MVVRREQKKILCGKIITHGKEKSGYYRFRARAGNEELEKKMATTALLGIL